MLLAKEAIQETAGSSAARSELPALRENRGSVNRIAIACIAVIGVSATSQVAAATYYQVADSGHIISYTYDQFLTGTGGQIVGQANGYGNDAGFFFMADASDNPALVPLPASLPLLAIAIGAVAALRFRRTPARFRRPD
jgi:hypothetical protein